MGSYWSVPYLTKKSVLIEPAVKHETTEEKKAMDAESVKEMVANDMLHIEPFVEIEEKRALTPIIEENTHSIETQTDAVAPAVAPAVEPKVEPAVEPKVEPAVEPLIEVKVEVKVDAKVEVKVEPVVEPVVAVQPVAAVEPVVAVEPLVEPVAAVEPLVEPVVQAAPLPDLSSKIAPPNQFNSVSHAIKKSNKRNRRN